MAGVSVHVDTSGLVSWKDRMLSGVNKAAYLAGIEASRRMRAEGSRLVRDRKNLKRGVVSTKTIRVFGPKSPKDVLVWYVQAGIVSQPVIAFKGGKKSRTGWTVSLNTGSQTTIAHAFRAKMKSGHIGIFERYGQASRGPIQRYKGHAKYAGRKRQPIRELYTAGISSPFKYAIPAMAERGRTAFSEAFTRVMRTGVSVGGRNR